MKAYRKRTWSALAVNMTPLIDVVFLIIIFFIIMINFSEMHIRKVNLPKADQTQESQVDKRLKIPLIIQSKEMILLDRTKIKVAQLKSIHKMRPDLPRDVTVVIKADEEVSYGVIKEVMQQLSLGNISRIEFSTVKSKPASLQEE
jgi:biopolymer transport protein ExbD